MKSWAISPSANRSAVLRIEPSEEWRPAPGYEGRYEVSSFGRVKSLPRIEMSSRGPRRVRGGMLNPSRHTEGYLHVSLRTKGRLKLERVHRLVCRAFHGEQPNPLQKEVAHLDGDTGNARADNLRWIGKVENEAHKLAHGTRRRGAATGQTPLTDSIVRDIRAVLASAPYGTGARLARQYGVSPSAIYAIKAKRRWKHVR